MILFEMNFLILANSTEINCINKSFIIFDFTNNYT